MDDIQENFNNLNIQSPQRFPSPHSHLHQRSFTHQSPLATSNSTNLLYITQPLYLTHHSYQLFLRGYVQTWTGSKEAQKETQYRGLSTSRKYSTWGPIMIVTVTNLWRTVWFRFVWPKFTDFKIQDFYHANLYGLVFSRYL